VLKTKNIINVGEIQEPVSQKRWTIRFKNMKAGIGRLEKTFENAGLEVSLKMFCRLKPCGGSGLRQFRYSVPLLKT
jgi:hypothetical protein